jgi:SecD/SecF fusion protein
MLHFTRWKTVLILLAILVGAVFALPNVLSDDVLKKFPDFMPTQRVTLGLDLQGGSHLMLKVEEKDVIEERLQALRDDVKSRLRPRKEKKISYSNLSGKGKVVQVRIRDLNELEEAKKRLTEITAPINSGLFGAGIVREVDMSEPETGLLRFTLTEAGLESRMQSVVSQSIEVIRRRIDELGTTEPNIQRQGDDRIIVQLPGLENPEQAKALLDKTAKLTFRMVNEEASVQEALRTRPPADSELLYSDEDEAQPYVIFKRVEVDGDSLVDAQPGIDSRTNENIVTFRFDTKGARRFGEVSSRNVGRRFAIVLDKEVITAPVIRQAILGGTGQISGSFTAESAHNLAILMRAGALPAKLTIVEERTVGPSLGQDSIEKGGMASVIAGVAVIVFMLMTYSTLGIMANIALMANMVMIIGVLSLIGATLTLPGIAGIVLTMGMAVDANVLIFERIREERRGGRSLIQAIDAGFKQALSTILDANITTLIAAFILFYLGSGPIRGFAITLAVGIITSVFTAFTLTRLLMSWWVKRGRPTALPKRLLKFVPEKTSLEFMTWRKLSFPGSAITILVSLALFISVGLNQGIDFQGGTLLEVQARQGNADVSAIRTALGELNLGDIQVQEFGDANEVLIRVESQNAGENAEQTVVANVKEVLEKDYEFRRVEVVGPTVSGELAQAGTIAVVAALLAIMVYIWFRFEWQFAVGAILATTHDVLLTIGMFALLQLEFNLSSIAAILTIVGYSLNDTVVVYDRIRENLRKYKKMSISDLLDMSINHTLSRTVLTSLTTLLALFALYFLGGEVLASFTFAMIFGIFVGTYSSIFIAAPLLILFNLRPGAMDVKDVSPYAGEEKQEVQ